MPTLPLSIEILCYGAVFLLLAIFLLLLRISSKLDAFIIKDNKTNSFNSNSSNLGKSANNTEPEPGSFFEEFLSEDPTRSSLNKKEQFEAYRKWRSEKGLNWSK